VILRALLPESWLKVTLFKGFTSEISLFQKLFFSLAPEIALFWKKGDFFLVGICLYIFNVLKVGASILKVFVWKVTFWMMIFIKSLEFMFWVCWDLQDLLLTLVAKQKISLSSELFMWIFSGIHMLGWTREMGIDYLHKNSGFSYEACVLEIDRYITFTGMNYCSLIL